MVVLLIGGESRLMDGLISKFNKDGHRVYLLTGSRNAKTSYQKVFEKYNFNYDSDSIRNILVSTNPDVVIFTGAQDTHYRWEDARKEAVQFSTDLTNILSAYSSVKEGRFLYLSSEEVFGKSYSEDIREEESVSASSFQAIAIAQGEEMCKSYYSTRGMESIVVRIDHLYGIPEKGKLKRDPCFLMTLEMLKSKKITANGRIFFSMLHQNDAIEFIYRLAVAEHVKYPIYHISSGQVISQQQLAQMIAQAAQTGVEVFDNTTGSGYRLVLSAERYNEEFNGKIFVGYEDGVKAVVQYMKRHCDSFLRMQDDQTGAGILQNILQIFHLLVPYIENMICFIPFFMLNNRAVDSAYFSKLDFYLLYVLLFAIVYGQQQAIFSAMLAIAGYCYRQMYDKTGFEILMDYSTYVWMAQLFIVGMSVGYMKDQIRYIRDQDDEQIHYLNGQIGDIEDINDSNVRMKHSFERQVVNQKDSLGKIYEITSQLEQREPEEVLFYAVQVLSKLMETEDAAVYTVANRDYARLFSFTSPTAKKLGKSIRYSDMEDMVNELREHRVYINKTMDNRYPLMAYAIYSEESMQTILMLWGLPWERMNLAEANRLTIVGYLIQNAVVRANRYLEALHTRRYVEGSDILEQDAFKQLVTAFFDARRRGLTECILLKIRHTDENFKETAEQLGKKLRQTDYFGVLNDGLYVLLPNTDEDGAAGVIERFKGFGFESLIVNEEAIGE
jgi:nucleoside-diphosphate-sugar epimerase